MVSWRNAHLGKDAAAAGVTIFFQAIPSMLRCRAMASASSFFSLAFSLSSLFSRFASETSRPPYLAFQL
jgi:hypothetical protein